MVFGFGVALLLGCFSCVGLLIDLLACLVLMSLLGCFALWVFVYCLLDLLYLFVVNDYLICVNYYDLVLMFAGF